MNEDIIKAPVSSLQYRLQSFRIWAQSISRPVSHALSIFALMLFVGIPLPGTGAWTGIMAASILNMGWKSATLAVGLGVILAGAIMMTASYFGFNLL